MVKSKKRNVGIRNPNRTQTSKAQTYKIALSPYTRKKYGGNKDAELNQALDNIKNKKDPISQYKDLNIIDLFIDTDINPLRKKGEIEQVLNDYKTKFINDFSTNREIALNIKTIYKIIQNIRSKEVSAEEKKAEAEKKAKKEEDKRLAKISEAEKKAKKEEEKKLVKEEAERIAKIEEEKKLAKVEAERKAKLAKVEAERVEAERVKAERVEAERVKAERVKAERVEAERVKAERATKIAEEEAAKIAEEEAAKIAERASEAKAEEEAAKIVERASEAKAEEEAQRVANIQVEATNTVKNPRTLTVIIPQFSNQSPILISSRETTQNSLFKTLTDNDN